jgi:diguanylate cyclase (GGDEF)-like protein/PAS domain S-box-containing protein
VPEKNAYVDLGQTFVVGVEQTGRQGLELPMTSKKRYMLSLVAVWTAVALLVGFQLNHELGRFEADELVIAREQSVSLFRLIETTREWNARHGGVYVPVSEYGQPNPALKIPERDLTATNGLKLTMINPAYMTRQIAELVAGKGNVDFHITSLKPIRPENAADAWERAALESFESGTKERLELLQSEKGPYYRYMAPLRVTKPCMKCHQEQGYKIGDIRGGISISMPSAQLSGHTLDERQRAIAIALIVFVVTGSLAHFAIHRNRRVVLRMREINEHQEKTIAARTAEAIELKNRYQDMAEMSSDWFWEQDENFRFVEFSGERKDESRLPFHSFYGKTRWELPIIGLTLEQLEKNRACCERHEAFSHFEYQIRATDGRAHWFSISGRPVFDAGGRFRGYRGTGTDITARKETELELRLSARVLEATHDGILVTDADARIIDANPSLCRSLGYSRSDLLGKNPRLIKSGRQDRNFYVKMWDQLLSTGHWHGEIWNCRRDGTVFPELLTISAVRDENGKLRSYVGVFSDISELKAQQERLNALAHHDALTGLPNRRLLLDRLEQAIAQASRNGEQVAVAFIDLDGFKPVNDRLGHEAGDELLKAIAARLSESVRGGDTAARLGGDEFVLVLVGVRVVEEVETTLNRVVQAIGRPIRLRGEDVGVTGSIGVAIYPADGTVPETLLQHADLAMYSAKNAGRNRFVHFRSVAP